MGGPDDDDDDVEEAAALARVVHALRGYRSAAAWEVGRWERNYERLSDRHQCEAWGGVARCAATAVGAGARRPPHARSSLPPCRSWLPHLPAKFVAARAAVAANATFLEAIAGAAVGPEGGAPHGERAGAEAARLAAAATPPPPADLEKVRYVLKNAVRDWGAEGAAERAASYGRLAAALAAHLPPPADPAGAAMEARPRILCPGSGLGRLPVELAAAGYIAEGNEFSYYMLLASAFILNRLDSVTIHPHVLTSTNVVSDGDQLRGVAIPDTPPASMLPAPGLLSMVAGDFCEVYARPDAAGAFDGVATCFFVDTTHSVLSTIDAIHHCLRPGGVWVNAGPLLYHWADAHTYLPGEVASVEVCLDDVLACVAAAGFALRSVARHPAPFNADPRSMATAGYVNAEWVAVKQ